jgi:hypothetical protein
MIRDVLRMGDPRLLQRSSPVTAFGTPELEALLEDLRDTMAASNGAGLAAPQIAVPLQVVIFGVEHNPRYPDAEAVPYTELVNPILTPLSDEQDEDWEGCLSVPGLRGVVPRFRPGGRTDPARGDRLPRPRGPARMRPSAGHPLSDADARPFALRVHGHHLPGQRARRGVTAAALVRAGTARSSHASRSCS